MKANYGKCNQYQCKLCKWTTFSKISKHENTNYSYVTLNIPPTFIHLRSSCLQAVDIL